MGGEASGKEWPFDTPPHVFELYVSLQKTLDYTGTWDGTINPVALGVAHPTPARVQRRQRSKGTPPAR